MLQASYALFCWCSGLIPVPTLDRFIQSMASKATEKALKAKEKVLQEEIEKFRGLQKDHQKAVASRTQLDGQLNENKSVKEELDLLEDDAVVYKLTGPVLVKQDLEEAKQTVQKRLDYIRSELGRYDDAIKQCEKKQEEMTKKLSQLQQDYQQSLMRASIR